MRKYYQEKFGNESVYNCHPWKIIEEEFDVDNNHCSESIFALGNGYLGVRGTLEEDYSGPSDTTTPGIYINGVYGSSKIEYGEKAPKQPELSQTIINLPDWTKINFYLDGEKFDMLEGKVEDYQRILDLKKGTLSRRLIWESPGGKKVEVDITRFVSMVNRHIGLIRYRVKSLNFSGKIKIISSLDGNVKNNYQMNEKKALELQEIDIIDKDNQNYLIQQVNSTGISIGMAMMNIYNYNTGSDSVRETKLIEDEKIINEFRTRLEKDEEIILTKYTAFHTSMDIPDGLKDHMLLDLEKSVLYGYESILQDHQDYLKTYWDDVDIKIDGDTASQQAFRFNAYQLLQSTGRDSYTNVPAKGLTGEYYEGHYFWDTEIYILPYFLYTKPEVARALLIYRYHILDQARQNAERVRLKGALFPWRTINGREASAFFMGSTVQFHINADIAFAINQYFTATCDYEFMFNYGVEILIETARMWASRGSYIPLNNNRYCFNEVCGPDEYKPGVSNSCYTNYMAKFNLEYAADMINLMKKKAEKKYKTLQEKLKLKNDEADNWRELAADILLPFNQELGIHPQDDSFLYKDNIDIESIPEEEFPLVKSWHPLTIWRYQVIKQADVILLMFLFGDSFDLEEKKANYDYYEPKTTHDSSLSPSIYSIIAAEIGYFDDAYDYFIQTIRLDLDDYNKNTYQGLHLACMGSSWMVLVQGFAGMRNYGGKLYFNPYLPEQWDGYCFKMTFRDRKIEVKVKSDQVRYRLVQGNRLELLHIGESCMLKNGQELIKNLRKVDRDGEN
ncbi:MAG: glycoside hydrolase family 65 protein [Halothermotrichaceae bacterium]